jgi:hypothetical protein
MAQFSNNGKKIIYFAHFRQIRLQHYPTTCKKCCDVGFIILHDERVLIYAVRYFISNEFCLYFSVRHTNLHKHKNKTLKNIGDESC